MDAKQYMIVDLEKRGDQRMFITGQVSSISRNANGLWAVRFSSSGRIFNYNPSRLLCLQNPKVVKLGDNGLYINKRRITDAEELLCFSDKKHTFYYLTHSDGYYENLEAKEVYITRTPIDQNGGSLWEYFKKLAAETGLLIDENENILSRQYELVDVKRDNVPLAQYLGDSSALKTYPPSAAVYYPFGCNASQKKAVERALTHQVSIIQGPPGTGKTQTILNIVANLLLNNKTVLIVSNNNSAVENVEEKLAAEGLGFIIAKLGSVQNKEAFIANQQDYPPMSEWMLPEPETAERSASAALHRATLGFEAQTRQAQLKADYDALLKEEKYHEMLGQHTAGNEWLNTKKTDRLLELLNRYKMTVESGQKPAFLFRLKWAFKLGMRMFPFLKEHPEEVISQLESAYYISRKAELEKGLEETASTLQGTDMTETVSSLRKFSLQLLKDKIARHYHKGNRKKFAIHEIKHKSEAFLAEYPVVLSTTYSAKNCISKDLVFDYVIMDEASQVDLKTGALTLSCALNAVIVGDDKQLPNVVSTEDRQALESIQSTFHVDEKYNAATHSFLQSCIEVFQDAPSTLLREHYRCHPKIIEFCNKRFYDNELVTMTADNKEENVLQVVRTVKGNHARGHFNQREADIITQTILPEYTRGGTTGIITPYRLQAEKINQATGQDTASTVHKYQGRECDSIIMSMVDNAPTEFSDDPNLLNVAISRAKNRLCIVTNGNEMDPDSNLAQLIAYIQYNNFEVRECKLHSVFDLLYKQYTLERLAYTARHRAVSEHLSENLIYDLLIRSLEKLHRTNIAVLCHYPLSRLITDRNLLDEREKAFVENPLSHIDFLLYNPLTKQPRMAIEVDGWHFHQGNEVQQSRDALKDQILAKAGLYLKRISTTDTVNEESMTSLLNSRLSEQSDHS